MVTFYAQVDFGKLYPKTKELTIVRKVIHGQELQYNSTKYG